MTNWEWPGDKIKYWLIIINTSEILPVNRAAAEDTVME